VLKVERPTGAAARRERGRREMRLAIIDEARRLVDVEGLDAVTIRGIARALGYSPGALYEYFDSKETILEALYFDGTDGLGAHMERTMAALPADVSASDAIAALGHGYRAFALEHGELYRLIFGGVCDFGSDGPPEDSGGYGTLMRVAQQGVADGTFAPVPAELVALSAWSGVHGFVSLELGGHLKGGDDAAMPPASPEEARVQRDHIFDAHIRMLLFGLVRRQEHGPRPDAEADGTP